MRKLKLHLSMPTLAAVLAIAAPAAAMEQGQGSDRIPDQSSKQAEVQEQEKGASPGLAAAVRFDIQPQSLDAALLEFSKQAGIQIFGPSKSVSGKKTPGIHGEHVVEQALQLLLKDSGLTYRAVNNRTVAIGPMGQQSAVEQGAADGAALRMARVEGQENTAAKPARTAGEEQAAGQADDARGTPEILVKGKRSLNTDAVRTEDAPQPYVVFGREEIQRSQSVNLEDFLRTQLPMNNGGGRSSSQGPGSATTRSSINLRGLGTNQTLILIDGRRVPGVATSGRPFQPDINGIPMAAVERIEVLPTTAGGIYGGSATGGVINIVMRRDFRGVDARATYANTFDTDAANLRLDANAGFSLEGGRTQVMIAATHQEANILTVGDRDLAERAIALQLKNNRGAIENMSVPPLGATANIRSIFGDDLVLDDEYGGAALGSTITHLPLGYAGPNSDGGAALRARAGAFNLDMPAGMNGSERGLLAAPSKDSFSINVRREFGARVEAFVDFTRLQNKGRSATANVPSFAILDADAPNNPFQQTIGVRFPTPGLVFPARSESTTERATGGIIARLPGNWVGEIDYAWGRSHTESSGTGIAVISAAQTALDSGVSPGDGLPALNVLQEGNTFPLDFTPYLLPLPNDFSGPFQTVLRDATLRFSGPVFRLPGGSATLSTLIEHREEVMQDAIAEAYSNRFGRQAFTFYPQRSQNADSAHLEANLPLIGRSNQRPLLRELQLQLSVRHDRYETESDGSQGYQIASRDAPLPELNYITSRMDSTDYTVGFRVSPVEDVALRASFGTGFLPPAVTQIVPGSSVIEFPFGFIDRRRGDADVYAGQPYTLITSGNPNLKPEHSESWSAGLIFTPRVAPGLRLSVDYTSISKVDEIQSPDIQFLLDYEEFYPDRITRGAPASGQTVGLVTEIDASLINIAETRVKAWDLQVDYRFDTAARGSFHVYALATLQPMYRNRLAPFAPVTDTVGLSFGPLDWRGNIGLTWDRGPLTLAWNAQLYDSYFIYSIFDSQEPTSDPILSQGSDTIPRQIYHDLIATWRFDGGAAGLGGLLADAEISLGIQNLFDKLPPILADTEPAAPRPTYSHYGDARLRRYTLSLRKSFK